MKEFENFSDDELRAIAGIVSKPSSMSNSQDNFDNLSNDELFKIAGINPNKRSVPTAREMVAQLNKPEDVIKIQQEPTGFINNVIEGQRNQGAKLADIIDRARNDERTIFNKIFPGSETAFQLAGHAVGSLGSLGGAAIKSGYNFLSDITPLPKVSPQDLELIAPKGSKIRAIYDTPENIIKGFAANAAQYEKSHPRESANLESFTNLAPFFPLMGSRNTVLKMVSEGAPIEEIVTKTLDEMPKSKKKDIRVPTSNELKAAAQEKYAHSNEIGAIYTPEVSADFENEVLKLVPKERKNGKMTSEQIALKNDLEEFLGYSGKELDVEDLKNIYQDLDSKIEKYTNSKGKMSNNGRIINNLKYDLKDKIDNIAEDKVIGGKEAHQILKEANKDWSTYLKLEKIEKIIDEADLYDNPATNVRAGLRRIYRNKREMRSWSTEEREYLRDAIKTGSTSTLRTVLGSRLLSMIMGGALGGSTGAGGVGALIGTAAGVPLSALSRKAAMNSAVKNANKVIGKVTEYRNPQKINENPSQEIVRSNTK